MKIKLIAPLLFVAATLPAAADTLADWTFETSLPTTAGPFHPEAGAQTATAAAMGIHAGSSTYSNPVGNGSAHSFSSTGWAVGDAYQFEFSTVGFNDVMISFAQSSSNTGPGHYKVQYSLDGTSFTDIAGDSYTVLANAAPNNTWSATVAHPEFDLSFDLTSVSAIDNASTVFIRLTDVDTVSANNATVASGGTDRIDNFDVIASALTSSAAPESTSTFALLTTSLVGLGFLVRRKK